MISVHSSLFLSLALDSSIASYGRERVGFDPLFEPRTASAFSVVKEAFSSSFSRLGDFCMAILRPMAPQTQAARSGGGSPQNRACRDSAEKGRAPQKWVIKTEHLVASACVGASGCTDTRACVCVCPLSRGYKSAMCRFHAVGRCNRGNACFFAHSKEELRVGYPSKVGASSGGKSSAVPRLYSPSSEKFMLCGVEFLVIAGGEPTPPTRQPREDADGWTVVEKRRGRLAKGTPLPGKPSAFCSGEVLWMACEKAVIHPFSFVIVVFPQCRLVCIRTSGGRFALSTKNLPPRRLSTRLKKEQRPNRRP